MKEVSDICFCLRQKNVVLTLKGSDPNLSMCPCLVFCGCVINCGAEVCLTGVFLSLGITIQVIIGQQGRCGDMFRV